LGVHLAGWPVEQSWGSLGVQARALSHLALYRVAGQPLALGRDVLAGLRYGRSFGVFRLQAGLDAHYTTLGPFQYTDDTLTEIHQSSLNKVGGRLAVGGVLEAGPVWLNLELGETFVPFPVVTTLYFDGDYAIDEHLSVRIYGNLDARSATFTLSDNLETKIHQSLYGGGVGVGYRF